MGITSGILEYSWISSSSTSSQRYNYQVVLQVLVHYRFYSAKTLSMMSSSSVLSTLKKLQKLETINIEYSLFKDRCKSQPICNELIFEDPLLIKDVRGWFISDFIIKWRKYREEWF